MNDEGVMAICEEIDDDNALEERMGTNSLLSSDLRNPLATVLSVMLPEI